MPKLLVLLLLADQWSFIAGVETTSGLVSQSFQNSTRGAAAFLRFAGPITEKEGGTYNVCLVPSGNSDPGALMDALETQKIVYAMLPAARYNKFAADKNMDPLSIKTAANACTDILKVFGRKDY